MKLLLSILLTLCTSLGYSQNLKIVSWNVQSGDNHADTIASQIKYKLNSPDILLLSEVSSKNANQYFQAFADIHEGKAKMIMSEIGGADRMLVLFSLKRLKLVESINLAEIALFNSRLRPSQAMIFRDKETAEEFMVINNHLSRGDASDEYKREAQAYMLQNFTRLQKDLPVYLMGDFNFDYELDDPESRRSRSFDILRLAGNGEPVIFWVKPDVLVNTQCSWDASRQMCRYNSILDFAFTNEAGLRLKPKSRIIQSENDFPDGKTKSDHRPVLLELNLNN